MRTLASISNARAAARPRDRPRCTRAISAICSPIMIEGLSAVLGSWCTMVIRAPQVRRIRALDSSSRLVPSK